MGGVTVQAREVSVVASELDRTFEAFFADHYLSALRLAALLVGDRSRAEDTVCDAFAKVYARWQRGGIEDVDSYLRQAIVNCVRSGWRRRSLEQRKDPSVRQMAQGAQQASGFEQRVVDRDAVWNALDQLSDGQRRVIVLRYYEDLTEAEVARLLGISLGTVKSQGARGIAMLQRLLGER